jgi:hypothetical protein
LTLQHLQLVTQNKNLDLLLLLRPHAQDEQLEQTPQRPVNQREDDPQRTRHLLTLTLQVEPLTTLPPHRAESIEPSFGTHTLGVFILLPASALL